MDGAAGGLLLVVVALLPPPPLVVAAGGGIDGAASIVGECTAYLTSMMSRFELAFD